MTPPSAKSDPQHLALSANLARALGTRRSQRLLIVMRETGLPPEVLLDLALEIVDIQDSGRMWRSKMPWRTQLQSGSGRMRRSSDALTSVV